MINVIIVSQHFKPENTAAANRINALYSVLSEKEGINANVFTFSLNSGESEEGVSRIKLLDYKKSNFIHRFFGEAINSLRLILNVRKEASDFYIVSSPSVFLLIFSVFLPKDKLIVDIRDAVWCYLKNSDSALKRIVGRVFGFFADIAIKRSRGVSVSNDFELKYVRKLNSNSYVFSNGISFSQYQSIVKLPHDCLPIERKQLRFFYAGNIGDAQKVDLFIEKFQCLDDIRFDIVGDGNRYDLLVNKVVDDERFFLHGKLAWDVVREMYNNTDVTTIFLEPAYDTAIPSKVYEAVCLPKPVLVFSGANLRSFLSSFPNVIALDFESRLDVDVLNRIKSITFSDVLKSREIVEKRYLRENVFKDFYLKFIHGHDSGRNDKY